MSNEDRYVFIVEFFDQQASLFRKYQLTYFMVDKTLEMYDLKNRRMFLKRCEYPSVTIDDLFIGATVTIYSRQLKLVEYGDVFTRTRFESKRARTFAMIKPDVYTQMGKIIDAIYKNGFSIAQMKLIKMTMGDAREFYKEHEGRPFYDNLTQFMSSDYAVGLELVAEDAIQKWRSLIGPTNVETAKMQAPNSLRALFGSDGTRNACHGSDANQSAKRESDFFFSPNTRLGTTAILKNCACCIIKPHAVQAGVAGQIIDFILEEGFEISAMEMFYLDKPTSEEFLEVYKGVLPEYTALAEHLTTGPSIALEIRQENAVASFREICGPHDPEVAKHLRPNTIRALFGLDRVRNAVHCTDLPEDGTLECEYMFRILQDK
mmetsp:Transcript_32340/g.36680  ORF Transcript_32340/g.36680 Transcript_32340/m.36680 type:complete len:376 (+) Transcript_32340:42-1169(+)|eukprot:CAMPEP_0115024640 /NCGR_PEP_ID=MMETSP0216-20121206/33408_1 /TAXON_ID=223996 /ORGANISM="Protocruzia adherens, Strain Boccale" /LENGTH=375 /DNA_ID=CAMNT_0002398837 /DNA_START=33 /DNA_END=1160 /DNA_ORIENTATION=-